MLSFVRAQRRTAFTLKELYKKSANSEFHTPSDFSHLKHLVHSMRYYHGKKYERDVSIGSRYHPVTPLEQAESIVKQRLNKACPSSVNEWNDLKNELMDTVLVVSELNFSGIVMNCLLHGNKYKEAHMFMDYLENSNMAPNHLTYLKYMAILGRNVDECDQNITLKTFQKVKPLIEAAPVLDKIRAEHVITGLCGTNQWFLALEYVKKYQASPTLEMKNSIAQAAIRNGMEDLAWKVMESWFKPEEVPSQWTFKAFLKYSLELLSIDVRRSERFLSQFFNYIERKYCVLEKDCVLLVEKYFRRHSSDWIISYSTVDRNGECDSCKDHLQMTGLTVKEFEWLRNAFLERSLMKSDIFINTTKNELNNYMKFINAKKPYNIILDGLNVAYSVGSKNGFNLARQLYRVINRLSDPSKRILILGKKHMLSWHKYTMKKISEKADLFLTSNMSQDDPFMIYAALESGPDSLIVSLDLMRDHVSRLGDAKLMSVFKRWQQSHQIYLKVDESNEIEIVEPLKYSITIHGNMRDGWHIPYDDKMVLDTYEELNNWLCIKKKTR